MLIYYVENWPVTEPSSLSPAQVLVEEVEPVSMLAKVAMHE